MNYCGQRAKKVMSDSPGLVDFAIEPVIFVLNLPDGQVLLFGEIKLQKDCNQSCQSKRVWGLVEMTCELVHASNSLHEWQAVKLTFFAPCVGIALPLASTLFAVHSPSPLLLTFPELLPQRMEATERKQQANQIGNSIVYKTVFLNSLFDWSNEWSNLIGL